MTQSNRTQQFGSADEALDFLAQEKERRQNEAQNSGNVKNNRFFLKHGQEGHLVFLDDLWFSVYEHQFWDSQNKRPIFQTCIQGIEGDCPGCEQGKPAFVMVTSVIHLDPVNKNGEKLSPRKRLFVAKTGSAERVLTRQKNQGTLVGKCFWLKRSHDQKAEKTGTDIDLVKEVNWDNLKKSAPENVDPNEWIKPYNYEEIFAPLSAADFRKALGVQDPVGASQVETPDAPPQATGGSEEAKQTGQTLNDLI